MNCNFCPRLVRDFLVCRRWQGISRTAVMLVFCGIVSGGFSLLSARNAGAGPVKQRRAGRLVISPLTRRQDTRKFDNLPWAFEPNVGQADARVKFLARANDATVFLTQSGVIISWPGPHSKNRGAARSPQPVLSLEFSGAARNAAVSGQQELPGRTNYLLGNDPRKWRTNVPHFSAVKYRGLYPGVDARFYGGPRGLEYDLVAAPRANLRAIALRASGATQLRLDSRGDLVARVAGRDVRMRHPVVFQQDGARRIPVAGAYRVLGRNSFGFSVGPHRADLPLVMDPSISVTYTTFLGGSGAEKGNSVAVDSMGAVYVGGTTTLAPFPEPVASTTLGTTPGSSVLFVAKVDTTQSGAVSLIYLTFLGGSGDNEGGIVAADNSASPANLAILGWTTSTDFPNVNPRTITPSGAINLTISKLDGTGNAFVYSEYYGGSGLEATQGTGAIVTNSTGGGIATNSAGAVFITSDTTSTDLPQPVAQNGFQTSFEAGTAASGTNNDGFFAKFNSSGALVYSTYFGIAANVGSASVAVDASGNAYVAGFTSQPSNSYFPPPTANPFQSTFTTGAADNAIVLKINPASSGSASLVYASFLGGSGTDKAFGIAVDNATPANAYLTGSTSSTNFVPSALQSKSFQSTPGSGATSNAFLAVVSQNPASCTAPALVCLTYASYLGGTSADSGQGIAVVSSSNILLAGKTTSADFPALCPSQNFTGTEDAFIAGFNPTAIGPASLLVSTFLGGGATAEANAIAADSLGDPIIFGDTLSPDYPLGANPNPNNGFQPTCASCGKAQPESDAFLTTLAIGTAPIGCAAFSPPLVRFGPVAIGTSDVPVPVQLANNGNSPLTISSMAIGGVNAPDFSVPSGTNSCPVDKTPPVPLAAGASCSFEVNFTPSVVGTEAATLQVADDGASSPQSLTLAGAGTSGEVSLSQSSISFGGQPQGTRSSSVTVTLTNSGANSLTINFVTIVGSNPTDFLLTGSNSCSGAIVPASGDCDVTVAFFPNEPAPPVSLSAQVNISFTDDVSKTTGIIPIMLSGTETSPPAPIASISPASLLLNFNTETVGVVSGPQPVTITNTGSAALLISGIGISGTNSGDFNQTNNCPIGDTNGLAVNASCTISVTFTPSATGSRSASLSINDNASPGTQTITLSGTGTTPGVTLSPTSLSFGNEDVGSATSGQNVTLTNSGSGALTISSIGFSGADPSDFAETSNCPISPATLASGNACVISVTFQPTATGSRSANLSVSDTAAGSPQTVALSGTGTQPVVSLSPASGLTFPATVVGATSGALSVTATNTGDGPLVISSITFTGANAADFSASAPSCMGAGVSVAPGGNCTVNVSFDPHAPDSPSARAATLVLTDNASPSTQNDAVSGDATDFSLSAASGGSTSATVTAGQAASFSLQLNPVNGFSGTVSFGCTNAPPQGSCTVSPTSLQITGANPVSFSVSVSTSAGAAALLNSPGSPNPRGPWLPLAMWALLALALLLLLRARGRRRLKLVQACAFALSFALLCSCSASTSGTPGGTPPGKYTVIVNGSVPSGTARPLQLTVTVN